MALPPVAPAADDAAPAPPDDTAAAADDTAAPEGEEDTSDVLLTVCKEADGTYSLIKGDEEDADGADMAGSADVDGTPEQAGKQMFDSKGALLKAILDILNEDESSGGADGSSEDQFQSGFGAGAAPPAPAAPPSPMPQKY